MNFGLMVTKEFRKKKKKNKGQGLTWKYCVSQNQRWELVRRALAVESASLIKEAAPHQIDDRVHAKGVVLFEKACFCLQSTF